MFRRVANGISMKVSIVVPSKGCKYLEYLLWGLREQVVKPYEIVLVLRECDVKAVENLCRRYSLPCIIIEQQSGFFTHALNLGKKEASGDITIFTDDDAIPLSKWVERHVRQHTTYRDIAGVSSRDVYLDLKSMNIKPTPDDEITTKLYRWFIRPWLEQPHPLLKKYKLGVYLTKSLNLAHGPYIPDKICYSLPFRGVNICFNTSYIYDIWFPEHKLLKRAPGNEQYFGLQLVLKGFDTLYIPNNPVLHIMRQSLSRGNRDEICTEFRVMRSLYAGLIARYS